MLIICSSSSSGFRFAQNSADLSNMLLYYNLLLVVISAAIASVLLDETKNVGESPPVEQNNEGFGIFLPGDAEPNLNIAFTGIGQSEIANADLDPVDNSILPSINTNLPSGLDSETHTGLELGDTYYLKESENSDGPAYDLQDYLQDFANPNNIALDPSDPKSNPTLSEEQSNCGSSSNSYTGKVRREPELCRPKEEKLCPNGRSPYCCDGNRYLYGLPTPLGYRVAYCAACQLPRNLVNSLS